LTLLKITGYFFAIGCLLSSCASYKQNIMFVAPSGYQQAVQQVEANYVIHKNDLLQLEVYTNLGEKLVDPNLESFKNSASTETQTTTRTYLVDLNGIVKFPLINELKVEGLTLRQAEEILQKEYAKYYQQPFVMLKYNNKRVIVLGAPGGQVIPLTNENMKLTEILALAKGVNNDAKAHNIRVMRGDQLFVADLSTFEGYKKNDLIVQPGDIVYVEPIRRPLSEGLRDYGAIISIVTGLTTLAAVLIGLNR
jgi:polysaccharide biosynthesis/export protein